MKFVHVFSRSVRCELTVSDEPPEKGKTHIREIFWAGQPKRKHWFEYVRWSHEINRYCADLWQYKITHAFQVSPTDWEFWGYEPGKPPKRLCLEQEEDETA